MKGLRAMGGRPARRKPLPVRTYDDWAEQSAFHYSPKIHIIKRIIIISQIKEIILSIPKTKKPAPPLGGYGQHTHLD